MFDLYTEKARRVIFFTRYEASQFGSPYVESEHLLFGLFREAKGMLSAYLGREIEEGELRLQVITQTEPRAPIPTSVDLPLSDECKRILAYAAEGAQRLAHKYIGTEHLLLGILREEDCLAARLLSERGISLEQARAAIAASAREHSVTSSVASSGSGLGSGSLQARVAARPNPSVRFVNEAGEDIRSAASNLPMPPRISEAVTIARDGASTSYRVLDVEWCFVQSAADTATDAALAEIVVRLTDVA